MRLNKFEACKIISTPFQIVLTPCKIILTPFQIVSTLCRIISTPCKIVPTPCKIILTLCRIVPTPCEMISTLCKIVQTLYKIVSTPSKITSTPGFRSYSLLFLGFCSLQFIDLYKVTPFGCFHWEKFVKEQCRGDSRIALTVSWALFRLFHQNCALGYCLLACL